MREYTTKKNKYRNESLNIAGEYEVKQQKKKKQTNNNTGRGKQL